MRRLRRGRDESGQGIAYVLVIAATMLILLVALVSILTKESRWVVRQSRKQTLLHIADAGIDRGLYALQKSGNWDTVDSTVSPPAVIPSYDGIHYFEDQPGMRYTVNIQSGNWTTLTPTGDAETERTITVLLTNTRTGEHHKVQAVVIKSTLNSALFSGGGIAIGGTADVNWGPVVSYASGPNSIVGNAKNVDHPIYMAAGGIVIPGMHDCSYPMAGVCYNEYASTAELGAQPIVPVDDLRNIAKQQGTWYGASTPGACADTPAMPVTNADGTSVVFYDTCNSVNYDPLTMGLCGKAGCSGTNVGTYVKFTGGCGRGTLVVMGNLDLAGNGTCASIKYTAPVDCNRYDANGNTCPPVVQWSDKLFWDGFIYVAGNLGATGTKEIYGTIYAYNTAGIGGTFVVWYKSDNKSLGYLGKSVFVKLWMERKPANGDVFP